jgi:hypothetical protein
MQGTLIIVIELVMRYTSHEECTDLPVRIPVRAFCVAALALRSVARKRPVAQRTAAFYHNIPQLPASLRPRKQLSSSGLQVVVVAEVIALEASFEFESLELFTSHHGSSYANDGECYRICCTDTGMHACH